MSNDDAISIGASQAGPFHSARMVWGARSKKMRLRVSSSSSPGAETKQTIGASIVGVGGNVAIHWMIGAMRVVISFPDLKWRFPSIPRCQSYCRSKIAILVGGAPWSKTEDSADLGRATPFAVSKNTCSCASSLLRCRYCTGSAKRKRLTDTGTLSPQSKHFATQPDRDK